MSQVSKDLTNSESDESKWLKAIIPLDFINQAIKKPKSTNSAHEISEAINSLLKETSQEEGYQIIIVNISDKGFECPGMIAEDKVLNEYEKTAPSRRNMAKGAGKHHHQHHRAKKCSNYSRKEHQNRLNQNYKTNLDNLENSFEPSLKLQSETGADRDEIRSRHEGSVGKLKFETE